MNEEIKNRKLQQFVMDDFMCEVIFEKMLDVYIIKPERERETEIKTMFNKRNRFFFIYVLIITASIYTLLSELN